MTDDDVRDILARAAREHVPDPVRIRTRFEQGRAAQPTGRAATRPAGRPATPGTRRSGWALPLGWAVAAACAVTAFTLGTGGPDAEDRVLPAGGPTPGASPTTAPDPAPAPTVTAPLPEAVVTRADGTPDPDRTTPGPDATGTRPPAPASAGASAGGANRCDAGARLVDTPYVVANNQWNAGAGTGRQCVRLGTAADGATAWTAQWTWSGDPGTVKAYPSVVRGWHWGWGLGDSALSVRLDSDAVLRTAWSYRLEESVPGRADVSTILTMHRGAPSGPDDAPDAEVHIVLATSGLPAPPRESVLETVKVRDAGEFDVTRDGQVWTMTSVDARDRRQLDVDLDLLDATRLLEGLGLDQTLSVSGIVSGADVSAGSARLVTTSYRVTVR